MIDPFAYGEPEGACTGGVSLWQPELQAALQYKAGTVLNTGFAPGQVTMADIDNGAGKAALTTESPAVLAFVRAIGLRKGDVQRIVLSGPHGEIVGHSADPLGSNKDEVFFEVGRKAPALGWQPGDYKATYTVTRDGQVTIEKSFTTRLSS